MCTLASHINADLGSKQGKKHLIPDLLKDVDALMESLKSHRVYDIVEGHMFNIDEKSAPDVVSVRLAAVSHGTSSTLLGEFNNQYDHICECRRMTPVSELIQQL